MVLLESEIEEVPSFHIDKYPYECQIITKNNCFSTIPGKIFEI